MDKLVVFELLLIGGAVAAFVVWQLRSVERDQRRAREAKRESEGGGTEE